MAELVSNLITLVLSLAFFGSVNAGGGDKDQKNESDKKTEVDLDLVFCACGGNPAGIVRQPMPFIGNCLRESRNLEFGFEFGFEFDFKLGFELRTEVFFK